MEISTVVADHLSDAGEMAVTYGQFVDTARTKLFFVT